MGLKIEITAVDPAELDAWFSRLGFVRTAALSPAAKVSHPWVGASEQEVRAEALKAARESTPAGRPKPPEPEPEPEEEEPPVAGNLAPMSPTQKAAVGLAPTAGQPTVIQGDTTHDFPEPPPPPSGHMASEFGGWRKIGEPSPGRKRRTKQEMAEDDAWSAEQAAQDGRLEEFQAISAGEARVDPAQAAEQAAIDAQDAADEAAESTRLEGELTHDDLRHAIGDLTGVIGVAKAAKLTKEILGCGVEKVPATQEALAQAVAAIRAAIELGGIAPPAAPPVAATREEVVKAITAYALRFDGTADFSRATLTADDIGSVVQRVAGVRALSKVEDTPQNNAKLLHAIKETLRLNPFQRVSR